ncbi:HAUS augmin-like complex subunit 2 isoform X2 [Engraulis encrasicolus]|uniref:HAUS augmin-like complex subunit 2 isoform X2 n=1 Tax=Engraulis encrasicolus TaxID=184585 RepID=UPI002FD67B27
MLPSSTDTTIKITAGDPYPESTEEQIMANYLNLGLVTQEEIDALQDHSVFSANLYNLVELNEIQHENDESTLQFELLQMDKGYADIAADYYLNPTIDELQRINTHLETILREQNNLKKRLMQVQHVKGKGLPVHANTHKYLVELVESMAGLLKDCEAFVKAVMSIPCMEKCMNELSMVIDNFQSNAKDMKQLHLQVMQWRDQQV